MEIVDIKKVREQVREKSQEALAVAAELERKGFDKVVVENQKEIAAKLSKSVDSIDRVDKLRQRIADQKNYQKRDDRPLIIRFWSGFKFAFAAVFLIVFAWHAYGIYQHGGGFTAGTFVVPFVFAFPAGTCLGLIKVLRLNENNRNALNSMFLLAIFGYPLLLVALVYALKLIFNY